MVPLRSFLPFFALLSTLSLTLASESSKGPDHKSRNLRTIQSIYDLTVFPNNVPIITQGGSAVPPGLFAANATGRISPVGTFNGFTDSIEYFFGLALVPQPPGYAAFNKATVVEFVSACPQVAASVAYLDSAVTNASLPTNGQHISTLKQVAFWRFDETGAVTSYDAWIPNLSAWSKQGIGGIDTSIPQVDQAVIAQLCPAIQQRCTGANQQYTDVAHCVSALTGKNFGDFDEAWGDNVVCRTIHATLTLLRPEVHCPHVGPTGGGKCIDLPYNQGYFDDQALFGMPLGQTFMCPSDS